MGFGDPVLLSRDQETILEIVVVHPLHLIAIVGIVVIIIRQGESAEKIEEYLKAELDDRTQGGAAPKEEIEAQNMEITDSINYIRKYR